MAKMLGKESKHAYDKTPKKEIRLVERKEVREEANQAVLQRKKDSKCSKPQGTYCRIHNPAPRFSNRTPEEVFESVFPKHPNLAVKVVPPVLGTKMEEADKHWRESRTALYQYAKENNIHPASIMEHAYGWYGIEADKELASLNKTYTNAQNIVDEEYKTRSRILNRYMGKLIEAEFSDPTDQKIAKAAVLCRFTVGEDGEDQEENERSSEGNIQIEKIGVKREAFYQIITEETFAQKVTNIETEYLKTALRNNGKVEELTKKLRNTREDFSKLQTVSREHLSAGADLYFQASNFITTK